MYDIIIIGSGLGGLQCGYILSKQGLNVCVLEKNAHPGGCIQCFRRGKHTFDTGFHYVGGLDPGQPLHRLFDYFGLLDLPWHRLDENGFDEIILNNESFRFVNGFDCFAETLSARFPHQRENLKKYTGFLQQVSEDIFNNLDRENEGTFDETSLFAQSAYDYLSATIDDPLLRQVLSGASLKMELNPSTLPLYIFAQINSSYIQSAWRLKGGGSQIADTLIRQIEANGGTVYLNAEVTRLIEENGRIVAAEIISPLKEAGVIPPLKGAGGCRGCQRSHNFPLGRRQGDVEIRASHFIADIHPTLALDLITESKLIRNIYRKRIHNLENTFGIFTVNIALKDNMIPYQNRNIYVYQSGDVWQYATYKPVNVNTCALVSFQPPDAGSIYTSNIDILTHLYRQEVEKWEHTQTGRRGDDYIAFKNQKAEACIRLVTEHIPCLAKLKDAIERIYTSTSLTYRDYTGTPYGSAYGIRKNYKQLLTTLLSPRTPIPNLFLTGQNLNLHGVLGVSITSFLSCSEITGQKVTT